MPNRLATLKAVRGKPGEFRCSLCNEQFTPQPHATVIKQFKAHLRTAHPEDPFPRGPVRRPKAGG